MMLTFDRKIPRKIQLSRSRRRKRKGRKHEHRIGPTRKQPRGVDLMKLGKAKKRSKQIQEFWNGEREKHPCAKRSHVDMDEYLFAHYGVVPLPIFGDSRASD